MCEPLTAITLITAAIGTASAVDQGERESAINKANVRMADQQAEDAQRRGGIEEERQLAKMRQIRAQQAAILGASNVDVTTGTPALVLDQTTTMGSQDAITIRSNAAREAFGYSMESANYSARADNARVAGTYNGLSTLLAGSARAYGHYKK
jgi:hypothetical protein